MVNIFQKIWIVIGTIVEWFLITMTGVSIMGCIAAAVQNRPDIIMPMAIMSVLFYGTVMLNRKVNVFIVRCCATK